MNAARAHRRESDVVPMRAKPGCAGRSGKRTAHILWTPPVLCIMAGM